MQIPSAVNFCDGGSRVAFWRRARQNRAGTVSLQIEEGEGGGGGCGKTPAMSLHWSNSVSRLGFFFFFQRRLPKLFFQGWRVMCGKMHITQTHYELLLASSNTDWSTLVLHLMMHYQLSSGWIVALAGFTAVCKVSTVVNSREKKKKKKPGTNIYESSFWKKNSRKCVSSDCTLWLLCAMENPEHAPRQTF